MLAVLSFLLLMQLSVISTSGLLHTEACGSHHIRHSSDSGHELFFYDGELVDKDFFCKFIKLYIANHCFISRFIVNQCFEGDLFSDGLPAKVERRFLRYLVIKETRGSVFSAKYTAMGAPGLLLLCCTSFFCCFRSKKKDTDDVVLVKESNSMDSAPSVEMNSVSGKTPASPLRVPQSPGRFSMSPKLDRIGSVHLTMNQVARATQNFSPSLKLGEGGFGTVYKAQLQDGRMVAIKRASKERSDALRSEFRSEIELLAKIEHRNLVKLLGYVDKGNERLIITEFVPNGTLRDHLDGIHGGCLDFSQRLEISIDIAHGLTYLHLYSEKQIIHRDVKSSNILLTDTMRAKVADFGFARLGGTETGKTHVVTKVKGTVGYLDPEYMRTFQLTPKSDVYSFGVLLVEILTGRRPVESRRFPDEKITIRWAFGKHTKGETMDLVDPQMMEGVDGEIFEKMLSLAFQCVAPTRADRPDMKSVGEQLWAIRMDYLKHGRRE
ncbi:calmodulin-binding receptor-like cytoplasmic kinase 3 isoform X1 [Cynara cardunculus var. scolymus]|uniref:calmodulin-binding receptor-like cytoplasmic kinase 3 isoform X1 n=1 Tax=Cynara cardunculus var. scolymus TaxID=59895 RepID=UPI000D62F31A|nr:calmodulin-binding receptor-like cytoplasmic kinase 3 isoform X1 [Cynara cardunculus var. scolymus]XP_024980442.1 calmodulin-binding receptor-like cytoplasmic kinase 3 isoform X1 [Cynara cardunculus var. scolymus]XP_024980443.1 calmodulin-binding receptor-like cytoplasmic kinase 3 isoform X1 [Cynara cardunculus var. scolymus]